MNQLRLLDRVTRDVADGLIVLDRRGTVQFANPGARKLLGVPSLGEGERYASKFAHDSGGENDGFHQFLLDAVYDKENAHSGEATYVRPDGEKRRFRLTSSFLFDDAGLEKEGVVIQFSDVTEVRALEIRNRDSARVFVVMMLALCAWVFAYAMWDFTGRKVSDGAVTALIEVVGAVLFVFLLRFTSIGISDMGLNFRGIRRAVALDASVTAVIVLLAVGAKAILRAVKPDLFPAGEPFFRFDLWNVWDTVYPVTVVVQEFLTRGVIHESVRRIIPGKRSETWALIVSSMFFGALHIHKGIAYMLGASLLLSVFGVIYRKQKTIWGLCIPHYVLGEALKLIFGIP